MSCLSLSGPPSGPPVLVSTPICSIGLPFYTAMLLINQSMNQSINQSTNPSINQSINHYYYTIRACKDLKLIYFTSLTSVQYNNSLIEDVTKFGSRSVSSLKDVQVHAPITCIKLEIPIYFIDHSEFIAVQCKKILSRVNNERKLFEFSSIKRALRPHLRTIIAI